MIKRSLFFNSPVYLSLKMNQLVSKNKEGVVQTFPIEDLGVVLIEHPQSSVSIPAINALTASNVALVFCDEKHMPSSMLFSLDSHSVQTEHFKYQVSASLPLKKNLWMQTVSAKIRNQASVLDAFNARSDELKVIAQRVKSGDSDNREAAAARLYWKRLLGQDFERDRFGFYPNNFLNYGYAILRAAVSRGLAGSGLLPTLGIFHRNRYNSFCLADDIMEPYRPYVDWLVKSLLSEFPDDYELTTDLKARFLSLLTHDVTINKQTRPLMLAITSTTASLVRCFKGEAKKISYPCL